MRYNIGENREGIIGSVLMENGRSFSKAKGFKGGAVMLINTIVVMSFVGVFVGKCYYYSKYSHRR